MHQTAADDLIALAAATIRPHRSGDRLVGDVGSALLTATGVTHVGVCIDTASGTGFCAEHAAIASMVTAGEYQIAVIVAVWRDDRDRLYVLPPCGRCRELIRQIDPANLGTEVLLSGGRSTALRNLLPDHDWPDPEPVAEQVDVD